MHRRTAHLHRFLTAGTIVALLAAGLVPAAVGAASRIGHLTVNAVSLNGAGTKTRLKPGAGFTVKMDFRSDSSAWCPKCQNQIVVGFAKRIDGRWEKVAGGKCIYSKDGRRTERGFRFRMTAPKGPGRYKLTLMAPQAYNCTRAMKWQARLSAIASITVK